MCDFRESSVDTDGTTTQVGRILRLLEGFWGCLEGFVALSILYSLCRMLGALE